MSQLKPTDLINDISLLIEQSQRHLATQANSTLTLLFWKIGRRINDDILQNKRADYGKQIVATVATQLEKNYGRSFSERNLRRMVQFSELFPDLNIVTPLATQLSWSHFIEGSQRTTATKEDWSIIYWTILYSTNFHAILYFIRKSRTHKLLRSLIHTHILIPIFMKIFRNHFGA